MDQIQSDRAFSSTIAEIYESDLVPMLFEPYAAMVADRLAALHPARVLEIAAGTGALTRAMCMRLPSSVEIVATDLNQSMLDRAIDVGTSRPVVWRQADALALPSGDAAFDVVVCQFGAMFFPDKPRAFAEARRVLAPGGTFVFSSWGRIENNEFAETVTAAMAEAFPDDPPSFLRRTPHGYFERQRIEADVRGGGFSAQPSIETLTARSRADSARTVARAYCEGTPLRGEIEARRGVSLAEATRRATVALERKFGSGEVDGKMEAHVVSVTR